ncbi:hypothetical protein [Sphingomonas rubra]|uniref:Flagellar FliJ protein n=1 Tax=Sphingomonas rubra TaxID=634430 RepID=A0A1I5UKB3_9SPHN|nr:hypothetical protein [Sphingomonas rubra]SFP95619.1 hypothetical protein SAMN04488241_11235 [Sphingomonas rubra]
MNKERTLGRIHRVRTLQLGLARAEEMRRHDALGQETALNHRIAGLVDAVAPTAELLGAHNLAASAHYRDRLQQSAFAAAARVEAASARVDAAAEASRAAKRDQSAVEKLLARARATALVREMRALEDAPPRPKRNRHDPC